ncbi:hypothetical protein EVAR_95074_1 [Eumeta japonica]|uniref:Uncharacterized protein n=1 Tax=Eumeta variegata TaxID=151549 RepID=A0A4C1W7V3_EUMVA|nr:hypothetical protein EVAR_95074_1 [Eumeta japonica]
MGRSPRIRRRKWDGLSLGTSGDADGPPSVKVVLRRRDVELIRATCTAITREKAAVGQAHRIRTGWCSLPRRTREVVRRGCCRRVDDDACQRPPDSRWAGRGLKVSRSEVKRLWEGGVPRAGGCGPRPARAPPAPRHPPQWIP